jgi:hypothetical protein
MSARHGAVALCLCALSLLAACESDAAQRAGPSLDLGADSMGIVPSAREIEVQAIRGLGENSGAAMSLRQPGVWFTINDSGNDPELFALDTSGRERGRWRIANARNRDWEAITLGPCLSSAGEVVPSPRDCLYIGEVGDNGAEHPSVRIYRVEEPAVQRNSGGSLSATALTFTYDGGARDVESMYAGPDGTLYFISKRKLEDPSGRLRPALVFALPPHAWRISDPIAALVDSLAIVPGSALGRQATDAAVSRDRTAIAVRTYTQLYVFRADSASGRIRTDLSPTVCSIAALEEQQGEGITWFGDAGSWLLTSEGRGEPMWVVDCPPPDDPAAGQPR